MTKRKQTRYKQYRRLKNAGFEIRDTRSYVGFNGGSETLKHQVAKMVAASVCIDAGYTVASEVECIGGEIDILAYGLEDRNPIAIELEHGLTEEVKQDKIDRYVQEPLRECYVKDLDELTFDPDAMYRNLKTELGL